MVRAGREQLSYPRATACCTDSAPTLGRSRPMEKYMRKGKTKNQILANRRKGHHKARNRRRRARAER